jgi:hypothetical protein
VWVLWMSPKGIKEASYAIVFLRIHGCDVLPPRQPPTHPPDVIGFPLVA